MVKSFFSYLCRRLDNYRRRAAIRQAQQAADTYRRKFLVLLFRGRYEVVSMQGVKSLIRQKRLNLTAEKARQIAVYEANPKPLHLCS